MKYDLEDYNRYSINGIIPVYIYKDGSDIEEYYKDYNNALYYLFEDEGEPEEYWYLIMVYVHKDEPDNVRWIINMDKENKYVGYEWDFKNHCPIK